MISHTTCTWSFLQAAPYQTPHEISFNLSFIHSFIPLTCAECNNSLLFSGASSIPLCYIPFPSTLFHQLVFHSLSLISSCHLFLGPPLNLVVPKFIHNTLLGILLSSILCTCQNQRNLNFTVSPCILIHQVLFTPTNALFHTTMYQSFKLY